MMLSKIIRNRSIKELIKGYFDYIEVSINDRVLLYYWIREWNNYIKQFNKNST